MAKGIWISAILAGVLGTACAGQPQSGSTASQSQPVETTAPAQTQEPLYYGTWKVDRVYGYSVNGHALKDEQLQKMVGRTVKLGANAFASGDEQLSNPVYKETPSTEFANLQLRDLKGLNIPEEGVVYVQVMNPADPAWFAIGNSFYVVNHDLLLLDAAGVFVQMIRE